MDVRTKWLWTLTAANIVTAILFCLAILGVLLALAGQCLRCWPLAYSFLCLV